jgi:exopolysaccharide production protein ExoQ
MASIPGRSPHFLVSRAPAMRLTRNALAEFAVMTILVGICFFNLSSLDPDKEKSGLDKSVIVKLAIVAISGGVGVLGLLTIERVRKLVFTFPGLWLSGCAAVFVLTSLTSIMPAVSIASAGAICFTLLFSTTALVVVGARQVVVACWFGMAFFLAVSFAVWLAYPALGVFDEQLSDGETLSRMAGISHPNTVGQFSGLLIGLTLLLYHEGIFRSKRVFLIVPFAAAAMLLAFSRSSIVALCLSLGIVYRREILGFLGWLSLTLAAFTGSLLLYLVVLTSGSGTPSISEVASSLSKSGDAEELTSVTGRTEIWDFTAQKISERPWTGFGPATSRELLKDHLGFAHNLWLHVAVSGGIGALLLIIGLTIGRVADVFMRPNRIPDFLILFIFVNGLTENVIFAFVSGATDVLLLTAVLWRANESILFREWGEI